MNKLTRALELIRTPYTRVEEPEDCFKLSFELTDVPCCISLQYKYRLMATFATEFWASSNTETASLRQAKRVFLETLFGDLRVHIEKLRLSILSRDGQALTVLQELEDLMFKPE